jgi:hypothetical protein
MRGEPDEDFFNCIAHFIDLFGWVFINTADKLWTALMLQVE